MAANPRAAAVAALVRQEQDGFSNLILDAELRRRELDGRDKAFASAIFYTVLEHRGTIDSILEQFLPKGLAKLDAPVREILRAAVAQARYMQVPVSAAVNEAVKLTRSCARPVSMTWTKPFSRMKSKSSWFSAPPAGKSRSFCTAITRRRHLAS